MNLSKKNYLFIGCATLIMLCCSCTFLLGTSLVLIGDSTNSSTTCRIDGVPCDEISENTDIEADQLDESYFGGENDRLELDFEEEVIIISYLVDDAAISELKKPQVAPELQELQDDVQKHHELWELYVRLFPESYLENIQELEITTDGIDGTLAAVYQSQKAIDKWILVIDIIDAYPRDKLDDRELKSTLIHEFGHILSFDKKQLDLSEEYFYARTQDQVEESLQLGRASCPTYYAIEGCMYADSYLFKFYDEFWTPLYSELRILEQIDDEEEYYDAAYELYLRHPDQFVTDYAAVNPGEDIAESWTAFILKDKPTGSTIADEKIRFFYRFPELVEMRQEIRSNL
ncbi:hypothetical protein KC909_00815 [Candidatus Dojkabacteria bacterium]|uniref:Uncharacterized protein n=1 Tax=Candidatus Dojkabacteria bacterium TaxID=2099670 RepID=A0A955L4K6_9BACT|nr:hypothetical protein [Candidatus Dojkabacteria bacterium]